MKEIPAESAENNVHAEAANADSDRRSFLKTVAMGLGGAMAAAPVLAQAASAAQQAGGETIDQLRQDMTAAVADDVKADLAARAKAPQELPQPKDLRPGAMLDARFPVYYETSVGVAMPMLTKYFAAMSKRDMRAVAETLHFPYATYEGVEPIVYQSAEEFVSNPPPSMKVSSAPDSQLRPGTYDIMDNMRLWTFNPVNVGLELCYTRYRADGYKIGINQGVYAITNNDGKWGIQLSSIIFTPQEYIGETYNDAIEAHLRQGRTGMAAFGEHYYDLLGRGAKDSPQPARNPRTTASIAGEPGARSFFLSAWAGKPMEPYNSKGRTSRLAVNGPNAPVHLSPPDAQYGKMDDAIGPTNVETDAGGPGWFFFMAGSGVGHYAYTMDSNVSQVLHAGPEKAHALGGYIRYTPDNIFVSETRSLGIMTYDLHRNAWGGGGGLGQSIRRDRSNDASPEAGSVG